MQHRPVRRYGKGSEQEQSRWDPKERELWLGRSKSRETSMEDRSAVDVQIARLI